MAISKTTFSKAGVTDFDSLGITDGSGIQIAGPCEVTCVKMLSGSGEGHVSLYDASNLTAGTLPNPSTIKWVMGDGTSRIDSQAFPSPIAFKNGIFAVLDQGANFKVQLCVATIATSPL